MTRSPAHFVAILVLSTAGAIRPAYSEVEFERDIRPIFAEKCTICHGPDDEKGGLRLTGIDFATRTLDSGDVAIVPGKPDESTLIDRIHTTDPDDVMPPPDKADPLTEKEKANLRQWIAEGAVWPKHWAYADLVKPEPPQVKQADWVKNPIDAFVLARLEKEGVEPSPQADTVSLIRRLYVDLIGLPPTMDEVARYREDLDSNGDAALSNLVDGLLASRRFGERWGRHWLDKARYADSDGYEKDNNRPDAWRYRDWVIDAINDDLPFDKFTIEQFAGDLLPDADPEQVLATAFNRQTLTNTEGGTDKEQWRVAAVMDRVETMGAVWLGLTLTCARCHTHKYDEITQAEYYQLFAYFNNGDESNAEVIESDEAWAKYESALAKHGQQLDEARAKASAARRDLENRMLEWEARAQSWIAEGEASKGSEYTPIEPAKVTGPKGVTFSIDDSGAVLAGGENPNEATYTVTGKLPSGRIYGIRLEALTDNSLGGEGPGRMERGNFVLGNLTLSLNGYAYNPLVFSEAKADFAQGGFDPNQVISPDSVSGKERKGWAVSPQQGKSHEAIFALGQPVTLKEPTEFSLVLDQNYGGNHTLGKFRISVLTTPTVMTVPEAQRHTLQKSPDRRTAEEQAALVAWFERIDAKTAPMLAQVKAVESKLPKKPEMDVRVIKERSGDRRSTHVFRRGEFKEPMDEVAANTLAVLPPVENRGKEGDRLDLARWLVSGENPLPPRVIANEVWANLFGEGIVTTLNDFGVRGDRPSHPKLLDWIAAEFIGNGWSRKQLIKTIVMSNTYRQSSNHRPELADIDPKNRLLARQNRFRVEAEIVRDLSLASAGLLSDKIGGPSVFPPIPAGVADVNYNSAFKWKVSEGEDRYRRGMYTFFKRTAPHPNLMTFDCPDSNVTCVQRTRSNTPLAALITLNNDTFVEASQALAKRVIEETPGADDEARIDHAFQLCLARKPAEAARDRLDSLLETSRAWYRQHSDEAKAFTGTGAIEGVPAEETAAWVATLRVLLNLDEFLTRS
ncbi:MAG: PSD1 domain-containing protein [Verrucomicrobiae bacterium]|nr:PSD1 domain-containing protein [Verrucomicrobiae bacterium]